MSTQPASASATTARSAPSKSTAVVGYVCAVLFPLLGFIIGAVLAIKYRGSDNSGAGIMITAVVVFAISLLLLSAAGSGA